MQNVKALSHKAAPLLRLHGFVKFNKAPKNLIILITWRPYGVLTSITALLRSFHGVVVRSYGILFGDCLCSDCASTAFFALPLRYLCTHTVLSRYSHCAAIGLHIPAITHSE
jgi:hypothetical protein